MAKPTSSARRYSTDRVDLRNGDCLALLMTIPDNSVDFIVTDPPYFLDQLGDEWDDKRIKRNIGKAGAIGGLPVGMRFDPKQGRRLERFFSFVSTEAIRVLKPG